MSKLVNELLSYSKTGIQGAAVKLESVDLKEVAEKAVEREKGDKVADVDIDGEVHVIAQPELLKRAVANVVRNAVMPGSIPSTSPSTA